MEPITDLDTLKEKSTDFLKRMDVIRTLFNEANELVKSIDVTALRKAAVDALPEGTDEEDLWDAADDAEDEVMSLMYCIARKGGYRYGTPTQGFWLPSTC